MSELDALPADQRAVLQLLLKQGKTYAELSALLAIDASAVQARAHDALDALGPEAGLQLTDERCEQVADYLLGQQTAPERAATGEYLASSAAARAWGRVVAQRLRPLAAEPLPTIPEEPAPEPPVELAPEPPAAEPAPSAAEAPASPTAAAGPTVAARPRSSRLGGVLLLGGVGVLVAVALVLILGGGGGGKKAKSASSTSTQSTGQPSPVAQINLMPAAGGKSVGLAQVFAQGNQRLLIVAAQSLPPGNYALWLFTSPAKARLLGFVPQKVDKQGRFVTQGVLPEDARSFAALIVTREQVTRGKVPTQPGAIALRGTLQTG